MLCCKCHRPTPRSLCDACLEYMHDILKIHDTANYIEELADASRVRDRADQTPIRGACHYRP
jgi:hypothetical protein